MFIYSAKDLALKLRDQRKKLGLSQREVSDRVGLLQKTISTFENNPKHTRLETLFRMLSAVNLEIQIIEKNQPITEWKEEW